MTQARFAIRKFLTAADLAAIDRFGTKVEELLKTPVQGQGTRRSFLKVENHFDHSKRTARGAPVRIGRTVTAPSDDELAAIQRRMRVFILEKERVNFLRIRSLVSQAFRSAGDSPPNDLLKRLKKAWTGKASSGRCPVPLQRLIALWFNSELFHDQEQEQEEFQALLNKYGDDEVRIWLMTSFVWLYSVLREFHVFLRDRTDIYVGQS